MFYVVNSKQMQSRVCFSGSTKRHGKLSCWSCAKISLTLHLIMNLSLSWIYELSQAAK